MLQGWICVCTEKLRWTGARCQWLPSLMAEIYPLWDLPVWGFSVYTSHAMKYLGMHENSALLFVLNMAAWLLIKSLLTTLSYLPLISYWSDWGTAAIIINPFTFPPIFFSKEMLLLPKFPLHLQTDSGKGSDMESIQVLERVWCSWFSCKNSCCHC